MRVVFDELVIPLDLRRRTGDIEGDHRVGVEVIALARFAEEVGLRVAEIHVDRIGLFVDRETAPHGRAAALPRVAAPRVVAGFARSWNRLPFPNAFARGLIERGHVTDATPIAIGHAHKEHVLIRHRLHRVERVFGIVHADDIEGFFTRRRIERDQVAVERTEEDVPIDERDATVRGECDHVRVIREFPLERTALGVDRVYVIVRRRHVHRAVPHDGRRLDRRIVVELEFPGFFEPRDVFGRDAGRFDVAVAAIRAPG